MAQLRPQLLFQVADPNEVFGQVLVPDDSWAESMSDACRKSPEGMLRVKYDKDLQVLRLTEKYEPIGVPYDATVGATYMDLTSCGTVSGKWKAVIDRVTGVAHAAQLGFVGTTEWKYYNSLSTEYLGDGEGLWVYCTRGACSGIDSYIRFEFEKTTAELYAIVWSYGENPRVEKSTDLGVTWTRLGDIPVADGGYAATGNAHTMKFSILRMNSRIAFRATTNNTVDGSALIVYDEGSGFVYPYTVKGKSLNASFNISPMTFESTGDFTSAVMPLLWSNTNYDPINPIVSYGGKPTGTAITETVVDTNSIWTSQYMLVFASDTAHKITPYVRFIRVNIPAIEVAPVMNPVWTDLYGCISYHLVQQFDPRELTVHRSAEINCRNYEGFYKGAYGVRAVRILASVQWRANDRQPWQDLPGFPQQRFIGFVTLTRTDAFIWSARLKDRLEHQLQTPLGVDIQVDDTCLYHTAKILLQKGNVTQEWLASNMPNAPTDAWECDGENCRDGAWTANGKPHIRIGAGTDSHPLYELNESLTVWNCLCKLAQDYGMALGFDDGGHALFYPWDISNARNEWSPNQVFTFVPEFDYSGRPFLNEIIGRPTKVVDTDTMRNVIIVRSLDPLTGQPIVAWRKDLPSIFGNGYGVEPPVNYIGQQVAWVDQDAKYSIQAFAEEVVQRRYDVYHMPILRYEPLECILQDLHIMDNIGIVGSRLMPGDDMFYISYLEESMDEGNRSLDMAMIPILIPYGLSASLTPDQMAFANTSTTIDGDRYSYATLNQSSCGPNTLVIPS